MIAKISSFFIVFMVAVFSDIALAEKIKIASNKVIKQSTTTRDRLGWVERIKIYPEKLAIDAKLTPGSEGNVLHATNIQEIEVNNQRWVSFESTDKFDKKILLKRKIKSQKRFVTTRGKKEKRYTVDIEFCLGESYLKLEFALANRSMFEIPSRIGRDALAGLFVIDPGSTRTVQPNCTPHKR